MSVFLTQALAAFAIAGWLVESAMLSNAGFFFGSDAGEGVFESVDTQRGPEGCTELLGEANGGVRAGDNSSDDREFDLSSSATMSLDEGIASRKSNERLTKGVQDHNRPPHQQSPIEHLVVNHSQLLHGSLVGRRYSDTSGNNVRGRAALTALMTLVGVLGVAWVAKHVSTYRRAAENLHLVRGDQQQLLTRVRQSRGLPVDTSSRALDEIDKSGAYEISDHPIGEHRAEVEPAGWHADLVAELVSTRTQLAELQKIVEMKGWSQTAGERESNEASKEAETAPLSFEEALDEIAKLEMELESLKQQRVDLSAITKIQEEIRRNAAFLKENVSWTVSASSNLGDADVLFRNLVALQEGFTQLGDSRRIIQVEQLKVKLRKTLDCAQETSVWGPALGELTLLLEEDRLKSELASIRAKVEQQSSLLSKVSQTVSLVNSSLQSSIRLFWWAVGLLQKTKQDTLSSTEQREHSRARRDAERSAEEQALASLRRELDALEDFRGIEQRVLRRINTYDRQQFVDWLSRKRAQARTAMEIVIAALSSLPNQTPSSIGETIAVQDAYSVTLESSKNKAASALNFMK